MTHWFRYTRKGGLANGLSFIDKIAKSGSNAQFRELIQLLSLFTAFKLPECASKEDFEKMRSAMQYKSEPEFVPTIPSSVINGIRQSRKAWGSAYNEVKGNLHFKTRKESWWMAVTKDLRADRLALVPPPGLVSEYGLDSKDVQHGFHLLLEESIWNRRNVPPRQVQKNSPFLKGAYGVDIPRRHEVPRGVGHLRYRIQANGKVRFFAAPFPVVQSLLKPLGDLVYHLLASCPWDCTFNQSAGVRKVQEWLREGRSCSSIDLTSATDLFPLSFQIDSVWKLAASLSWRSHIYLTDLKEHLKLFEYISREEWKLPDDMCDSLGIPRGSYDRWKTGQPLGTYPSFGMFALSHGLLVLRACYDVGLSAEDAPRCFVILGDDIVISDDRVADRYLALLGALGAKVSDSKSVKHSKRLAEFAGRIITDTEAFFKPKYLPVTDKTCISLVDTFGPKVIRCYNPFQRALISLPKPVGRDLNPLGFSLADRYFWALQLESTEIDKRRVVGPLDALRRKIEVDEFSDRPDLNVYQELTSLHVLGFKPGPADDIFFQRDHELRNLWSRLPPYVSPRSKLRYSYYTPSSWTKKARAVLPQV
jgi:hypothetical protein